VFFLLPGCRFREAEDAALAGMTIWLCGPGLLKSIKWNDACLGFERRFGSNDLILGCGLQSDHFLPISGRP
jgi:hypothetical protein